MRSEPRSSDTRPASGLALGLGKKRFGDLVALCERRLADAFGGRIARLYAWGIAGSYGLALFLVSSRAETILSQALVALSWIPAGLVALGAARDQARLDDENGFVALVRQRGFDERDLELARSLAAAQRILRVTGWPALGLVVLLAARVRTMRDLGDAAFAATGAAVYVLCLAVLLAALARASALISGGRGRRVFVALVLLPHVARALFPWMPSVPTLLGDVLAAFFERGGA